MKYWFLVGPQNRKFKCRECGKMIAGHEWFYSVRRVWNMQPDARDAKNVHLRCWGEFEKKLKKIEGGSK